MNISSKTRRILSFVLIGMTGVFVLFFLGTVLMAYLFPVPPTLADLSIFSPPQPKELDFSQIDEIIINDGWTGLALFSSYDNHYTLENDQGQFKGTANFSVGVFDPIRANVPLAVSVDEVKKFTDLLAQSKLERGVYAPNVHHTDDYPKIEIVLKYRHDEMASFSSISQEETHAPWKVVINGHAYVVQSDLPARALAGLKKNLRQDVLKSLINQAEK